MYDRYDGGHLIGKTLAAAGVRNLFCLQGGHIDPILYGCRNAGIRIVDTRHEQAAAHMAEGWGLATGETGVCAVTAGPGITDAVTGLANAQMSHSPLVCLSGRRPAEHADTWPLQDLDQLDMVRPITKWARSCLAAARCGEYTSNALAEARSGRPGPTYLDIPADVLAEDVADSAPTPSPNHAAPPGADPDAIDDIVRLLQRTERAIVLAGSGTHWSGAGEALARLAETAGLPVFSLNAGRGVLPDAHPWAFGIPNPLGGPFAQALAADVVICLGIRLGFTLMNGAFFEGKTVVRVDVDAAETERNRPGDHNIVADARVFCEQLAAAWDGGVPPDRLAWRAELDDAAEANRETLAAMATDGTPVHPLSLITTAAEVAGPDATLVADGGDIMTWAMLGFPAHGPGRLLTTGSYLGCLGVGIPFALAAKLARPDAPVVLVEGDGSFGLNAMEFDTAVRHGIPIVCVVSNDGGWGMSRHGQGIVHGYDDTVATELGVRPYHEVVRALGGYGESVDYTKELPDAIDRALASGLPACINVSVDPSICSPFTAAMAQGGLA